MNADSASGVETDLAAATARIGAGDLAGAESLLASVLKAQPNQPIALYLQGVIHFHRQAWIEAEQFFRRALSLSPGQPQVALHLAQTLLALRRPAEAVPCCRTAVAAMPGDPDALLELARALQESGALVEAENLLRRALATPSHQVEEAVRAALDHRLGQVLKLQRRHEEALAHMSAASADRGQALERANLLQHLRRSDEAAAIYQSLVAERPDDLQVHLLLNEIFYRHNRDSEFLVSYDRAQQACPNSALLTRTKANHLLKLERPAEALDAFRKALAIAPDDGAATSGLARALDALNDVEGARAAHEESISRDPENGETSEDYASFLLRRDDPRQALRWAERARALRPSSQSALALLGLCYRACADAREDELNGYESFVRIFDLEPPPGYKDMAAFNRDLAEYLEGLHGDAREYFSQTLRGGTRLYDEAFHNGHKLIDLLLPRINAAVQAYAADLGARTDHPFVSRRGRGFCYNGSWSSRLKDRGFHVNHIHQGGWISSCYYVAVPEVAADPGAKQGWIKFGEPSAEFGPSYTPRRAVQPVPGRLVLFPSYLWHGTVPFHSPQTRITIAFDAVPAQEA